MIQMEQCNLGWWVCKIVWILLSILDQTLEYAHCDPCCVSGMIWIDLSTMVRPHVESFIKSSLLLPALNVA